MGLPPDPTPPIPTTHPTYSRCCCLPACLPEERCGLPAWVHPPVRLSVVPLVRTFPNAPSCRTLCAAPAPQVSVHVPDLPCAFESAHHAIKAAHSSDYPAGEAAACITLGSARKLSGTTFALGLAAPLRIAAAHAAALPRIDRWRVCRAGMGGHEWWRGWGQGASTHGPQQGCGAVQTRPRGSSAWQQNSTAAPRTSRAAACTLPRMRSPPRTSRW